ncbi:MAG: UDP-N-acetylmuramoyl-L-alanine--D-glutamate ligase [Deltaproteobacteria bacterium]|nr:UDP-N-acetylmuramoyl-L-alanine--D-glutamate ligase [Deltaproteobacteria bacterium]
MVLGFARTGQATARFLAGRGAEVWVSDRRNENELQAEIAGLADDRVHFLLGGEKRSWLDGMDLLIPSPGVSQENSLIQEAIRKGIEILSEIEVAFQFLGSPLIAITGTNGKSTTTTLIGEMLKVAGLRVFVGGNIGRPLIGFIPGDWDWGVVEVSSFQLEWVRRFRPRIALLLNLAEDHLDRYPDFRSYGETKGRILAAQTKEDVAVLNRSDPQVWSMKTTVRSRVVSFGWDEVAEGVYAERSEIVWRSGGQEERFPLSRAKIQGVHNVENLMAAVAAVKSIPIVPGSIQTVIDQFPGLEHRLEFVREKAGVRFYNDSKGTNVGAVVKSLESFSSPVILLAGGVDKKGDYGVLEAQMKKKVKKLVLFGEARQVIREALGSLTETVVVDGLDAAVEEAWKSAVSGDVVLLSPACSSFDMFKNYAERGEAFKALVQAL